MDEITGVPNSFCNSELDFTNDLSAVNGDENAIVEILLCRLNDDKIYTWVGPLLLALNPGKQIDHLYDETRRNSFVDEETNYPRKSTPHVYAVANRALYRIVNGLGKINQVIVISGESGTGKTFNARKVLDFLEAKNETARISGCIFDRSRIIHKIGKIVPLVSAFSTARTARNATSSRHGQLLRLQYENNGVIRGARVHSFLLERTRVTECSNNFEIFYQLMSGLSDEAIAELLLSRNGNYAILGEPRDSRDNRCYLDEFSETLASLEALGFEEESTIDIFRVIAFIIHMGNIRFKKKIGEGCTINLVDEESRIALKNACSIVSLPEYELTQLLTTTLICPQSSRGRHTSYRRDLNTPEDCRKRLFSIARFIYDRLFNWLVERVNETLSAKSDDYNWLGILDIFGFEYFDYNGLEQLCINYATERLQLYFMEDYLEIGQREFEEEGLGKLPPPGSTQIYRDRLFVIEEFIFSTFNDASQSPIPAKLSTLRHQLLVKQKKGWRFFNVKNESFVIEHYSCPVEYNVNNILSKNTDKVPTELSSVFGKCENKLLQSLSISEQDDTHGNRVSSKKCTALAKLQLSLDCLVKELNKCDSHYVRCARPRHSNDLSAKNEFREQLAGTGIFDALPLAKCKLPVRFLYEEFYKRYFFKQPRGSVSDILHDLSKIVVSKDSSSSVHFGKRLIFFTEEIYFQLENYRQNHRISCAKKIQSFWMRIQQKRRAENSALSSKIEIIESAENIVRDEKLSGNDSGSLEDDKNSLELHDYGMKKCQVPKMLSGDTGYSSNFTTGDESQSLETKSQRSSDISPSAWRQNSRIDLNPMELEKLNSRVTIDIWKDFYVRNWLNFNSTEMKYLRGVKLPEGSTLIFYSNKIPLFYRNRILSRRCPVEIPVKFHTRFTCLANSHCLPSVLKPRGLQDCLSKTISSVVEA